MRASNQLFARYRPLAPSVALAFVTAAYPLGAQATAELPAARDLIARYATATNGAAVMAKHSTVRSTGRFELPGTGITGDVEILQGRPNKSLLRITIPAVGEILKGFDGTTGWEMNPIQGPRVLDGQELDAMREEASFGRSSREGPAVASAQTMERTEMNGEACYRVKLVWKSGRETFDCYSVATGLLVATQARQETQMGTVDLTSLIGDYKDFGGQKVATRLAQQVMGREQVITIDAVQYDAADAAAFELPPAIKALAQKKP